MSFVKDLSTPLLRLWPEDFFTVGDATGGAHVYTESLEFAIEPGDFARILKTGGKRYRYEVTAVWFQGGRRFKKSGSNMMVESFTQ